MALSNCRHLPARWSFGVFALLAIGGADRAAAQRDYTVEMGAAAVYRSYASTTSLKSALGGVVRLGYWFASPLSLEVEAGLTRPHSDTPLDTVISVASITPSLLLNFRVGLNTTLFVRAGYGWASYGGSCPSTSVPGAPVCGTTGSIVGGAGMRLPLSQTVLFRVEGVVDRGGGFTNYGGGAGLTFMIGSHRQVDSDHDGVYDHSDRCPDTPAGALVDKHGCPTDADGDGVYDGLDRCPGTPKGAVVDDVGCPIDSDSDGVYDGLDQCPDTPSGAVVDANGCPVDSDGDGVPDGLDRCPNTPAGATVDALGCPSDSDNDGVPDGLDQCPNTPAGKVVNIYGCPVPGQGTPKPSGALSPPAKGHPQSAKPKGRTSQKATAELPGPTRPKPL
jgi:hypothetical protein